MFNEILKKAQNDCENATEYFYEGMRLVGSSTDGYTIGGGMVDIDSNRLGVLKSAVKEMIDSWAKFSGQKKGSKPDAQKLAKAKASPEFAEFKKCQAGLNDLIEKYGFSEEF